MLQKNQNVRLKIEDLNSEGAGVGRTEGMVVFVPMALPGEEVEALIIKTNKSYCVGKLLRVLQASPDRVEPPCPYFPRCGGCQLQHMSYPAQLRAKAKHTQETLQRIGHCDTTVGECLGMEQPWRYRNKAQLPIGREADDSLSVGFFALRSHRIIDIADCMLQPEVCRRALAVVRSIIEETNTSVYDENTHRGLLRHLVVRVSRQHGTIMVMLAANGSNLPQKEIWVQRLRAALPEMVSFILNMNTQKGNIILGEKCITLWGSPTLPDRLCGLDFALAPLAFLQVNPLQAERLYGLAVEAAGLRGEEIVLDAYCGIGILTQRLAQKAKKAIGVEIVPDAIEAAKASAAQNGVSNAEFLCGACEELLPEMIQKGLRPDVLVLDPPRAGCEEKLLRAVGQADIPKIVYISCNPATLAKDMALLREYGYESHPAVCVDMFPMTGHVETVVLMERVRG